MLPLQDFKDYIGQNALFAENSRILLAVSGGRDSVLMVHLFKRSGYNFGIAHCNFNLRADESQRDESFVRMLAAAMDVPFHMTHFNTKHYAATHKISTQMAARELRYQWFEEISASHGYDAIALAQHQDDATETVLINLIRGTGIAGLHGILPKRGNLIRPLLFLSRKDIDQLIAENNIEFVEDSSNLSADYARNKIRLKVIPLLKEINPNLEQTFASNIQRFAETELVLQNAVQKLRQEMFVEKKNAIHLSINKIKALTPQKLLLFELLKPYRFSEFVVNDMLQVLNKQSGTSFYSNTHRITVDREDLIISPVNTDQQQNVMIQGGDHSASLFDQQILISHSSELHFGNDPNKAFADADKLVYPLTVRGRLPGDKFVPIGMKTFKKLSDFFIDEKIPLSEKDQIPVLLNGNGEIIWIAGLRQDNRYKLTTNTKKVVIFELHGGYQIKNK